VLRLRLRLRLPSKHKHGDGEDTASRQGEISALTKLGTCCSLAGTYGVQTYSTVVDAKHAGRPPSQEHRAVGELLYADLVDHYHVPTRKHFFPFSFMLFLFLHFSNLEFYRNCKSENQNILKFEHFSIFIFRNLNIFQI
jgi:hypothetical protein